MGSDRGDLSDVSERSSNDEHDQDAAPLSDNDGEVHIDEAHDNISDNGSEGEVDAGNDAEDVESENSYEENDNDTDGSGPNSSEDDEEQDPDNQEDNFDEPDNREDGDNQNQDFQQPNNRHVMYEGCEITKEEGALLISSFALRFGLSDLAIDQLLTLIQCFMPVNVYTSFHCFKKLMPTLPEVEVVRQYYCPNITCKRPVIFAPEGDNVVCECDRECNLRTLDRNQNYFLTLPLKDQLVTLLQEEKVATHLRWHDRSESDIVNAEFYKICIERGIVREGCDVTLQLNTDGVQVFTSSKHQMWPIQVSINELPFKIRKDCIILCGLWFGGKPNMNTFMMPLIDELRDLHENGFVLPGDLPKIVRVHTLLSSVDSMARPGLQGLKTFRGHCGCSFCLHPGEEHEVGNGSTRLYRGDKQAPRTLAQHRRDTRTYMERPRNRNYDVNGINAPAALLTLPVFNVAESFVPDYLHAVLLGVVKTMFCQFWTKSCGPVQKPYYLSAAKLAQINEVFLNIKPPCEITRTPRSLNDVKLWRGHEWKNWLLYYSIPCLKAVNFPARYLNHWFLLVYGISCFLKDHISEENFVRGRLALRKYVLTLEEVYETATVMKFNTHLLLHIPRSVQCYGGLWAWSTFSYEHYNGMLAKMFKSSQSAHLQICKNYVRLQGLKYDIMKLAENVHVPQLLLQAFENLGSKRTTRHIFRANRHLALMGLPEIGPLPVLELTRVEDLLGVPIEHNVYSYKRFIYKKVLHHVEGYGPLQKRVNSVVRTTDNEYVSITRIVRLQTDEPEPVSYCIIIGLALEPAGDRLCTDRDLNINSDNFAIVVRRRENNYVALKPHMIERKCVLTFYPGDNEKFCCFPLVNLHERD